MPPPPPPPSPSPSPSPPAPLQPLSSCGPWEMRERLGTGGFGNVLRWQHKVSGPLARASDRNWREKIKIEHTQRDF
uniref:Uncharacterized protein n=1 Tax=Naja naja TaxID=35670 RepID=A0A8C6X3I2_NAJNA